ncbi:MAG: serine/threonine-protein kinase [Deltaproteobacteria bacterium]
MRYCPTCATAYPNKTSGTCPKDGSVLVSPQQFETLQHDPLMGTLMGGRYHIVGRVGTGGMGTVYRAEQRGLGRPVALKVLKAELVSDRETVGRFQREAKAMSLLVHPNTVRVFDFGEDPAGHLFLAMELLEGELLTSKLEREGSLDIQEAVSIAQQILRSLHEAHTKGLVHRDLKPDNIYLARVDGHSEAVVKVLDFGIAKIFRDDAKPIDQLETQAGTVFGTPRYMSPEQAQGKALDPRSDLYSVAVLLFQLLAGQAPFTDEDAVVVMAKHIREEIPLVTDVVHDRPIPGTLARLLARALEKEPAKRFSTAEQFEQALGGTYADIERERELRASGRRSSSGVMQDRRYVPHAVAGAVSLLAVIAAAGVALLPDESTPRVEVLPPPTRPTAVVVATRRVLVESTPSGAQIWRGAAQIGTTPMTFDWVPGQPSALELRLDGHLPAQLDLATAHDREVVPLLSLPAAPPSTTTVLSPGSGVGTRPPRPRPPQAEAFEAAMVATTLTMTAPPPPQRGSYERFE